MQQAMQQNYRHYFQDIKPESVLQPNRQLHVQS